MENKKRKILIVDDDDLIRGLHTDVFRGEGYEVIEATDGLEGLDRAISEIPDVIFTGIIMPRMDGFSFKDGLSKNVSTSNIPVFMSSHMGREEDRQKALGIGIKSFFVVGMTTPKEVAAQINALFNSSEYCLGLNANGADAFRLSNDLKLKEGFLCPDCNEAVSLILRPIDMESSEFNARIICLKCKGNK